MKKQLFAIVTAALLLTAITGCISDNPECGQSPTFTVMAYDTDMVTELPGAVNDVVVYVFDSNDLFIKEIEASVGEAVEIPATAGGTVKLVAWGNLGGGNQTRPTFNVGDHIDQGVIELIPLTGAESSHKFPDELFMGMLTVEAVATEQIVPIYPKTGSIGITASYIHYYFQAEDLSVGIGTTYGAITLCGEYVDAQEPVSYRLRGTFESNVFVVEPVNLFAGNDISIIVFYRDAVSEGIQWLSARPANVIEGERTDAEFTYWPPIIW